MYLNFFCLLVYHKLGRVGEAISTQLFGSCPCNYPCPVHIYPLGSAYTHVVTPGQCIPMWLLWPLHTHLMQCISMWSLPGQCIPMWSPLASAYPCDPVHTHVVTPWPVHTGPEVLTPTLFSYLQVRWCSNLVRKKLQILLFPLSLELNA